MVAVRCIIAIIAVMAVSCDGAKNIVESQCTKSETTTQMTNAVGANGQMTPQMVTVTICTRKAHFAIIDGVKYKITAMELMP